MFAGAFGGVGKGMITRKARTQRQIAAVIPDHTSIEMRAQFLRQSTPIPVKTPMTARPSKSATVPTAMVRAALGIGGPACEVGSTRTTTNTSDVPSSTSTLPTMTTTPAAVTDAVGFLKVVTTFIYHLTERMGSDTKAHPSYKFRLTFAFFSPNVISEGRRRSPRCPTAEVSPMALTKRQKEVLDYLVSFENKHCYAPSFEEIGKC